MKWFEGLRELVMNPLLPPSSVSSNSIGSVGSNVSRSLFCSDEFSADGCLHLFLGALATIHSSYSSCIAVALFLLASGVSCGCSVGVGHAAALSF